MIPDKAVGGLGKHMEERKENHAMGTDTAFPSVLVCTDIVINIYTALSHFIRHLNCNDGFVSGANRKALQAGKECSRSPGLLRWPSPVFLNSRGFAKSSWKNKSGRDFLLILFSPLCPRLQKVSPCSSLQPLVWSMKSVRRWF